MLQPILISQLSLFFFYTQSFFLKPLWYDQLIFAFLLIPFHGPFTFFFSVSPHSDKMWEYFRTAAAPTLSSSICRVTHHKLTIAQIDAMGQQLTVGRQVCCNAFIFCQEITFSIFTSINHIKPVECMHHPSTYSRMYVWSLNI